MFDYEMIAQYVGLVIIGAVIVFALPWLKERIGAEKLNKLWRWVCWAVEAAEQLFGAGMGDRKKEYVLKMLADMGVDITPDVDAMVEAAVLELTPTHTYDKAGGETAEE